MNPLRGFEIAHGHPFATDRHPLTGISYPAHHRLYRHSAVHQPDAGVGGVAVDAGVCQGGVLVAAELQDGVVHLGAVEDTNAQQQVEVVVLSPYHYIYLVPAHQSVGSVGWA